MKTPPGDVRIAYARGQQGAGVAGFREFEKVRDADTNADDAAMRPAVYETNAMALLAVSEKRADYALIPFFDGASGYDFQALHDMGSLFEVAATKIVKINQKYCLAACADDVAVAENAGNVSVPHIREIFATPMNESHCRNVLAGYLATGAHLSTASSDHAVSVALSQGGSSGPGLLAAVVPEAIAADGSNFVILKHDIGAAPARRWMLAVQRAKDPTVALDKYKTTDARTRYFNRRIKAALHAAPDAIGAGVILRLKRDGAAASAGDVEAYLRNFGVRYEVFDLPQRDYAGGPPPRILDIEFDVRDFYYDPARRLRGAVANGALKLAFARWKSRGVQIVGAMPVSSFRMPDRTPRRWCKEGVQDAVRSYSETMFVRFSRLLFRGVVFCALVGLAITAFWYLASA